MTRDDVAVGIVRIERDAHADRARAGKAGLRHQRDDVFMRAAMIDQRRDRLGSARGPDARSCRCRDRPCTSRRSSARSSRARRWRRRRSSMMARVSRSALSARITNEPQLVRSGGISVCRHPGAAGIVIEIVARLDGEIARGEIHAPGADLRWRSRRCCGRRRRRARGLSLASRTRPPARWSMWSRRGVSVKSFVPPKAFFTRRSSPLSK